MLISRIGSHKINCISVPEGKQLSGYRATSCPCGCHVDGTGATASYLFISNWLREGPQEKEIPVLLFLSSCSLKKVCLHFNIIRNECQKLFECYFAKD